MKKTFLLKYEISKGFVLRDYTQYLIYTETIWFWGLFKTQEKFFHKVYDYVDTKLLFDFWDKTIENRTPFNK